MICLILHPILIGCGGILTGDTGAFTSPSFPEPYPADTECIWIIPGMSGAMTQLIFRFIFKSLPFQDLEHHPIS